MKRPGLLLVAAVGMTGMVAAVVQSSQGRHWPLLGGLGFVLFAWAMFRAYEKRGDRD